MPSRCCTALDGHHIAISRIFSSRIQQCPAFVFDRGPATAPCCVARRETYRVRPEPLSLINWMIPRHSARPVSYRPDWLRFPSTKPNNQARKKKKKKKNLKVKTHPLSCGEPSSLVRPLFGPRLVSHSSTEQLTLQHASIALVETECNAGQGWLACFPATANVNVPTGRSSGRVWPNSKPLHTVGPLLSGFVPLLLPICRDRCIRRAQFPRSPLITNVGGCGGQSSGHAPPRRVVPDWYPPACVNLKPVESNLSLSFETAAPTTRLRDPGPPHLVAHCVVTHTHTHTPTHIWQHTNLAISSCKLRSLIHPCRDR